MDYSVAGLAGVAIALVAGVIGYQAAISPLQRWLRTIAPQDTAEQRDDLTFKLGVMRRLILTIGSVTFAWGGYWLGKAIAG